MKKILIKSILVIITIYFSIMLLLFFNQKSLLYFPDNKDFYDCSVFDNEEQHEYNGTRFYEKQGDINNLVIFFHGNAGRACDRTYMKELLEKTNYSLIFVEYSGYADLENNNPNKKDILKDVENIGDYVSEKIYENIYVVGRSIGTGPASYFASKNEIAGLILISPYSQLYKVGADKYPIFPIKYLFTQNFNNVEYLKNYKNNILIIHGKQDNVVPYILGKELFDGLITTNKELIELDEGTHHNIFGFEGIENKIIDFLISK